MLTPRGGAGVVLLATGTDAGDRSTAVGPTFLPDGGAGLGVGGVF